MKVDFPDHGNIVVAIFASCSTLLRKNHRDSQWTVISMCPRTGNHFLRVSNLQPSHYTRDKDIPDCTLCVSFFSLCFYHISHLSCELASFPIFCPVSLYHLLISQCFKHLPCLLSSGCLFLVILSDIFHFCFQYYLPCYFQFNFFLL